MQGQEKLQPVGPKTTLRCFDLHSTFFRCSDLEVQPNQEEDLTMTAEFLAAVVAVVVVAAAAVVGPEHWLVKEKTGFHGLFVALAVAAAVVPGIVVFVLQVASM